MTTPIDFFQNPIKGTKEVASFLKHHGFQVEIFENGDDDDFVLVTNNSNDNAMIRINPLSLLDCRKTGSLNSMGWKHFIARHI